MYIYLQAATLNPASHLVTKSAVTLGKYTTVKCELATVLRPETRDMTIEYNKRITQKSPISTRICALDWSEKNGVHQIIRFTP